MTGHIPDNFKQMLLSRVDIVDVVSERLSLRRMGANWVGLCPFHGEKTPSFSVNTLKQFYHCFGCNVSGDAIQFLMEYDGLTFVESIETLANRIGLQVPREMMHDKMESADHTELYAVLDKAAQFYQTQLKRHPKGSQAIQYLKTRGLTGAMAKTFGIGFAPNGWDGVLKELGKSPETEKALILSGLVIRKDATRCYDRFRDRIMFPIRDRRGRVIGFGGRVLDQSEPKYLNSPETPVFSKGTELYGLYEARQANRSLTTLIVVEGYLDVISLTQFGISNAVATLGTAFSDKHVEVLFRTVPEIILCFDGDKAGREAANRAMKCCLSSMKEGRRVRFALLPDGTDPDSLVRSKGVNAFLVRLQHAQPLSDFLFDNLTKELDLTHIDGRAQLINLAKPLLEQLPAGIFQQMMWDRLGELSGFAPDRIRNIPHAPTVYQKKDHFISNFPNAISKSSLPLVSPAIRAVAILVHKPMLVSELKNMEALNGLDVAGISLLCEVVNILTNQPHISKEALMEQLAVQCAEVVKWDELNAIVQHVPVDGMEQELMGAIQRLEERAHEKALEHILGKAKMGELSESEKVHLKKLLDKREQDRVE